MHDDMANQAGQDTLTARAVTLKDIAAHCGVSLGTVSLALRDDPRISAATARRVLDAAAALGYDPSQHQAARRLALSKHGRDVINHVIALIVPTSFHRPGYFAELMQGVMDVLVEAGYCALTTYIYSTDDRQPEMPVALRTGIVDGVLSMVTSQAVGSLIEPLRQQTGISPRPVVSMIWEYPGCSTVRADDEGAGYAIARALLARGHRHLLHLSFLLPYMQPSEPQARRIAGATRALADAKLDPAAHLHLVDVANYHWLDQDSATTGDPALTRVSMNGRLMPFVDVLRAHPEITAVIGLNDASALRAWRLLEVAGYRVPEDISIVGFDDTTPRLDAAGVNLLASARVPLLDIGREAAALVIRQVTGDAPKDPVEIMLPVELQLRRSIGNAKK